MKPDGPGEDERTCSGGIVIEWGNGLIRACQGQKRPLASPLSCFLENQGEKNMFSQTIAMAPAAGSDGQAGQASPLQFYGMMAFCILIFYVAMIRPQRRREKERKALIESVKSGQRVLLTSGIIGEVAAVKEKTLLVLIAEKTKIEVIKRAVAQVIEEKDDLPSDI
ncbi:MAG: preprotein translocase subunit YajC [Pontiellaceae bacterium]|jgi:preprotein translocase subunit YajC|nr:preprotein translocase subunit YajC [Pontiellaceae bacterium]